MSGDREMPPFPSGGFAVPAAPIDVRLGAETMCFNCYRNVPGDRPVNIYGGQVWCLPCFNGPPRWTPRVLDGGGGDGEPVQLAFGLLGSIDGDGS